MEEDDLRELKEISLNHYYYQKRLFFFCRISQIGCRLHPRRAYILEGHCCFVNLFS